MADDVSAEHAVLYCDAGWLIEKKTAGCGIHGYLYLPEEPKRGTGNPKVIPTDEGYRHEETVGNKVTVIKYVDVVFGTVSLGSNNEAELMAFHQTLKWVMEAGQLKSVKIFSDSKFVVIGVTEWVSKWESKNWVTANGEPVKYKPLWMKVKELYERCVAAVPEFKVSWVKGHNGHPGNDRADLQASRGLALAIKKDLNMYVDEKPAQGYWNVKAEIPRIMQAPRWYFSTVDHYYKRDESILYYVGCHGTKDKEDDLVGKPYADNFLGVVKIKNPDPIMEILRETAIARDKKQAGSIIIGYLDAIFSPKTYQELLDSKTRYLIEHSRRIDVGDAKGNPVLVELSPVGRGFRQAGIWESLTRTLDGVIANEPTYRITDITDVLYEVPDAKKGIRKLKPSITQVTKYLDLMVEFNLESTKAEPKPFLGKVRLIVGSDILSRNQLAALAEDISSVKVISWRTSDIVARYATLVELKSGDVGLWARFEANIFFKP